MPRKKRPCPKIVLIVPTSFDPALVPGISGREEQALWVLHAIASGSVMRRKPDRRVPLSVAHKLVPNITAAGQRVVIPALVEAGVIETDGSYWPSVKSKEYGLAAPYRSGLRRHTVCDPRLARRILRNRRTRLLGPAEAHLLRWATCVRIDTAKAHEAIRVGQPSRRSRRNALSPEDWRELMRATVDTIDNSTGEFVVDRYGRVHTPVTRLWRDLRPFLHFPGHGRLVEIDVRASQPIFLALRIRKSVQVRNDQHMVPTCVVPGPGGSYGCACAKAGVSGPTRYFKRRGNYECDLCRFVRHALEGPDVYNDILRDLFRFGDLKVRGGKILTRDHVKDGLLKYVMYGNPDRAYWSKHPFVTVMDRVFPGVVSWICSFHEQHRPTDPKRFYRHLAWRIQRDESELLMRAVLRVKEQAPHQPILTIHDSILTPVEGVPLAVEALRGKFRLLGVADVPLKVDGKPTRPVDVFNPIQYRRDVNAAAGLRFIRQRWHDMMKR